MSYPYKQLSFTFAEAPEVEYCDPVVQVGDWERKVLAWAQPRPADTAIAEYLLATRLVFAADDPDDLGPFDTWPPEHDDDLESFDEEYDEEFVNRVSEAIIAAQKAAGAPCSARAKCSKCGFVNEYAAPSDEYVCFECRV